jgi:hypothetical protein
MKKLNISKIILLYIVIIITQLIFGIIFLGAMHAYLGIPVVWRLTILSPLICMIGVKIIINLFLGFIASKRAKTEGKKPAVWFFFTLFFGLSAIAILYLETILEKINKLQSDIINKINN